MSDSCLRCRYRDQTADSVPCRNCYNSCNFEDERVAPQPVKTLLDEYAMNAPFRVFEEGHHGMASFASSAYSYAAAMMHEKMRRDEMGNVKEKEV